MDALDQLLNACHSRALNLFVSSFMSIIEILLEEGSVPLKSRATKSVSRSTNFPLLWGAAYYYGRHALVNLNLSCNFRFRMVADCCSVY